MNMEPILFSTKFFDWPQDSTRIIKSAQHQLKKNGTTSSMVKERDACSAYDFSSCNIEEMRKLLEVEEPGLELENFNVRRGVSVYDEKEFRAYQIRFISLKTWHANSSEFSNKSIDNQSIGHFY